MKELANRGFWTCIKYVLHGGIITYYYIKDNVVPKT